MVGSPSVGKRQHLDRLPRATYKSNKNKSVRQECNPLLPKENAKVGQRKKGYLTCAVGSKRPNIENPEQTSDTFGKAELSNDEVHHTNVF